MSETIGENSVIFSNLPFSIKEPEILAFCAQAGDVLKVQLTTHSNSSRSKGWAIVTYKDAATSQKAIEILSNTILHGRPIYLKIDRLYERQAMKDLHNLFIVNIPWEMKAQHLTAIFKEFNPVASIINCSLTGKSLGSGIVGFNSLEEATDAKNKLNKSIIGGREIRVNFEAQYEKHSKRKPPTNSKAILNEGDISTESTDEKPKPRPKPRGIGKKRFM